MKKRTSISSSSASGFTLVEMLVSVAISILVIGAITLFARNTFYDNSVQSGSLSTVQSAEEIIRNMVSALRSTSPGSDGSYPIVTTATNTLVFFSDIDGNGIKERIRYFLATTTLQEGITVPTGSPLSYNLSNEQISTLAVGVRNTGSTPIFNYFDDTYSGTSSPLTQPVTVSVVRLVQINLLLDQDPNRSPAPRTYTSDVTLRNLKDNL